MWNSSTKTACLRSLRIVVIALAVLGVLALCGCQSLVDDLNTPSPAIRGVAIDQSQQIVTVEVKYALVHLRSTESQLTGWFCLPGEPDSVKHAITFAEDTIVDDPQQETVQRQFHISGYEQITGERPPDTRYYFQIHASAHYVFFHENNEENAFTEVTTEVWRYHNGTWQNISDEQD